MKVNGVKVIKILVETFFLYIIKMNLHSFRQTSRPRKSILYEDFGRPNLSEKIFQLFQLLL